MTSRLLEEHIAAVVVLGRGKENDAMWHVPQNVTPEITRSSESFSTVPPIVNGGDWGCIVAGPRDYHCLGLTRIQFHTPKVTPLTNPAKVTDQGLCYCNSDAWGWHNSH